MKCPKVDFLLIYWLGWVGQSNLDRKTPLSTIYSLNFSVRCIFGKVRRAVFSGAVEIFFSGKDVSLGALPPEKLTRTPMRLIRRPNVSVYRRRHGAVCEWTVSQRCQVFTWPSWSDSLQMRLCSGFLWNQLWTWVDPRVIHYNYIRTTILWVPIIHLYLANVAKTEPPIYSVSGIAMGSVVTWPWLFQMRNFRQFGSAAIPHVVYAVRSAFLATATLFVIFLSLRNSNKNFGQRWTRYYHVFFFFFFFCINQRLSLVADELTNEALLLMNGDNSHSQYYDLRMNPVLMQLAIAACALFILIVVITFFCCIEIRR